jgi:hypothetical protein
MGLLGSVNGVGVTRVCASDDHFRLFYVAADPRKANTNNYVSPSAIGGSLTLESLTLSGGLAKGGDSNGGGGGAGMGGAIFSQGTVMIENSTLTANTGQGGSAINTNAGPSGGGIGTDSTFSGGGGGEAIWPVLSARGNECPVALASRRR